MKENSNPTVHVVRRRRRAADSSRRIYLDRSAQIALNAAAEANADNKKLDILKQAGLCRSDSSSQQRQHDNNNNSPIEIPFISFGMNDSNDHYLDDNNSTAPHNNREEIDSEEVFDMIRDIDDPEHPLTLEQLNVVCQDHVKVDTLESTHTTAVTCVSVNFTPTIPHCSMATLIGLSIRVKLLRSLPDRYKVFINIQPGTHASEKAINRQLNDKERVAAALENSHLLGVVDKCIGKT